MKSQVYERLQQRQFITRATKVHCSSNSVQVLHVKYLLNVPILFLLFARPLLIKTESDSFGCTCIRTLEFN